MNEHRVSPDFIPTYSEDEFHRLRESYVLWVLSPGALVDDVYPGKTGEEIDALLKTMDTDTIATLHFEPGSGREIYTAVAISKTRPDPQKALKVRELIGNLEIPDVIQNLFEEKFGIFAQIALEINLAQGDVFSDLRMRGVPHSALEVKRDQSGKDAITFMHSLQYRPQLALSQFKRRVSQTGRYN